MILLDMLHGGLKFVKLTTQSVRDPDCQYYQHDLSRSEIRNSAEASSYTYLEPTRRRTILLLVIAGGGDPSRLHSQLLPSHPA